MFFYNFTPTQINTYKNRVKLVGALSNIFSANRSSPSIPYHLLVEAFCHSFNGELRDESNLINLTVNNYGVCIRTFDMNSVDKFVELLTFNNISKQIDSMKYRDIVKILTDLWNERVQIVKKIYNIQNTYYHFVLYTSEMMIEYWESKMDIIDFDTVKDIKVKDNSIFFKDDKNSYYFNMEDETLYINFYSSVTSEKITEHKVYVIEDPIEAISNLINLKPLTKTYYKKEKYVVLPLYSFSKGRGKYVPERSGLNQWNANGRARDCNEVYVPIPVAIRKKETDFFPNRLTQFALITQGGRKLVAKVSQQSGKALMTYPNRDLGSFILRDILGIAENEVITYEDLVDKGIDSIKITKKNDSEYYISFLPIGSYDNFIASYDD